MPNKDLNDLDPIKDVEDIARRVDGVVKRHGRSAFERYPLMFSLLATFGIVSVIYGFQETIHRVPFLGDRPFLILIIGLVILSITGELYKRLEG